MTSAAWTQTVVPNVGAALAPQGFTPVEGACVVKFSNWPSVGTAVTNEGTGGAGYNATTAFNDYLLLSNGAKAFQYTHHTDTLDIPHGAAVDNLGAHTFEFIFRWDQEIGSSVQKLWDKGSTKYYCTMTATSLAINRYDTGGTVTRSGAYSYTFSTGKFYHVQITWDGATTTSPTVRINNVSVSGSLSGTVSGWYDDSVYDFFVGNRYGADRQCGFTLLLFRLHSRVLTSTELTNNFLAESWRTLNPSIVNNKPAANLTVPGVTVDKVSPAIATSSNITQTVVPDVAAAKVAPAVGINKPAANMPIVNIDSAGLNSNYPAAASITPYETGCTVKYVFDQVSGAIINKIDGTYNLTPAAGATNAVLANGAYVEKLDGSANAYAVAGSALTLGDTFSIEIIVAADFSGSAYQYILGCYTASPGNGWEVLYGKLPNNFFYFTCYNAGSLQAQVASTAPKPMVPYHLIFTFDKNAGANNLKLYIGGTINGQVTTGAYSPITGATNLALGGSAASKSNVYLVRVFNNVVLTSAQVLQNYQAEQWRYSRGAQLGVDVGKTQTVVPDVSHSAAKPSIDIGVSPVSPNITAQTLQPALDIGSIQTVVPDIRLQTSAAPTIGIGVTPTVPDVRLQKVSPAVDLAITQQTVPDVTSAATKPAIQMGITQRVVPDVALVTNALVVSHGKAWAQTVVPTATLQVHSPKVTIVYFIPTPRKDATVLNGQSIEESVTLDDIGEDEYIASLVAIAGDQSIVLDGSSEDENVTLEGDETETSINLDGDV